MVGKEGFFDSEVLVLNYTSKTALVIIENGTCWVVENFVLSRYNYC